MMPTDQTEHSYYTIAPERSHSQSGELPYLYLNQNRGGQFTVDQVSSLPSVAQQLKRKKREQEMNHTRSVLVDPIEEDDEQIYEVRHIDDMPD